MSDFEIFPDMEAVAAHLIQNMTPAVQAFVEMPATIPDEFVMLHQSGSEPVEPHTWDGAEIHFDVYGIGKSATKLLARTVRVALMDSAGTRVTTATGDTAWISTVKDSMSLQWLPDAVNQVVRTRYIFALEFICKS